METFHGYIKNPNDALLLFEACRVNRLKRVQRRLAESERATYVRSGAIFVWDEEESGIKRWTDGKHWSPSRINGSFLIYREVEPRRRVDAAPGATENINEYVIKEDGLTKKAISINTADGHKQHIVSYYTRDDARNGALPNPSDLPQFADLVISTDIYPEFMPESSSSSIRSSTSSKGRADAPGYTKGSSRRAREKAGDNSPYRGPAEYRYSTSSFDSTETSRQCVDSGREFSIYSNSSDDSRSISSFASASGHLNHSPDVDMTDELPDYGHQLNRVYGMSNSSIYRHPHRSPSISSTRTTRTTPADLFSDAASSRHALDNRSVISLPAVTSNHPSNRPDLKLPLPRQDPLPQTSNVGSPMMPPLGHQGTPIFLAHQNWTPDTDYGRRLLQSTTSLSSLNSSNSSTNAVGERMNGLRSWSPASSQQDTKPQTPPADHVHQHHTHPQQYHSLPTTMSPFSQSVSQEPYPRNGMEVLQRPDDAMDVDGGR